MSVLGSAVADKHTQTKSVARHVHIGTGVDDSEFGKAYLPMVLGL